MVYRKQKVVIRNVPLQYLVGLPEPTLLKVLQDKEPRITKLYKNWKDTVLLTGHIAEGEEIYVLVKSR